MPIMIQWGIILRRKPFILAAAVLALAVPVVVYLYRENQGLKAKDDEVSVVVREAGNVAVLPANEQPTLVTVEDTEKLKGQSLFERAQNGDKLLIYKEAGRVYMYRPSERKIVDIAPVATNDLDKSQRSAALLEAGGSHPAIPSVERTLREKVANVNVLSKQAAVLSYKRTTVIDLEGTHGEEAAQIASVLNAEVSSLRTGERKPEGVDFLIIAVP